MYKKILSLILVCTVLSLNVAFNRVQPRADVALVATSGVVVVVLGALAIMGITYLNQDTIAGTIGGYLDHLYSGYDEYSPTAEQQAFARLANQSGSFIQVMDDEVYNEFEDEYNSSIIYTTTTKNGRKLTVYEGGNNGAPTPKPEFIPLSIFKVKANDIYTVGRDVLNYYKQFFDKLNQNLTITDTITFDDNQYNNIFGKWGENYFYGKKYSQISNYQNGDVAVRVYFNSGNFDLIYNRPYTTNANNDSYYMYMQGTCYFLNGSGSNYVVQSGNFKDWDNHSVRGNTYSWLRMGCVGGNPLYPYVDFGAGQCPFSFDENSPYYIKGIYFFGDYFDLSGLIDPENMPDEWIAPDDLIINQPDGLNLPDDFNFDSFKQYLNDTQNDEFPNLTPDDEVNFYTPSIGTLPNTLEYPALYLSNVLGTNPNLNPDVNPSPAPMPENLPLPSDEPINTGDENLDNLQLGGFMNKFPFCVPQDLYNIFNVFVAEPQAPVFKLSFPTPMFSQKKYDVVVDLSNFDSLAALLRRIELIGFCLALALITRNIIKG